MIYNYGIYNPLSFEYNEAVENKSEHLPSSLSPRIQMQTFRCIRSGSEFSASVINDIMAYKTGGII